MSRFAFTCLLVAALGCTEGVKPNPLPRAGVPPLAPRKDPEAAPAANGTLYERLGRERGLTHTVDRLVETLAADAKSQPLAAKLNKQRLVEFLMEVASKPRPRLADDVNLSPADWSVVLPALRTTLTSLSIPDADRDELLANVDKSR